MAPKECSMSKRAYKTYSKEFKVEAIRLAAESDKPGGMRGQVLNLEL